MFKKGKSMPQAILSTTYFGPVQWYQKLCRYDSVLVERFDSYRKQTYRNRCTIATAAGTQALTVPVERNSGGGKTLTKDVRISDHGNWRHLHWHALQSAYSESPFFEYYADDIRPFFERRWTFLYDFNAEACATVCSLLDIHPDMRPTDGYVPNEDLRIKNGVLRAKGVELAGGSARAGSCGMANETAADSCRGAGVAGADAPSLILPSSSLADFRDAIDPKHPAPDPEFAPRPYYQVFARKNGFQPNLSILDLLFNMGPEGIFWLQ